MIGSLMWLFYTVTLNAGCQSLIFVCIVEITRDNKANCNKKEEYDKVSENFWFLSFRLKYKYIGTVTAL